MTQTSWSIAPSVFGDVVGEDLAKLRTTIALEVLRNLILRTPIRDGRARGGWFLTYSKEYTGGERKDVNKQTITGEAISEALSSLQSQAKDPYAKVVLINSIEYIVYLEHGTIKMKPFKMVALTMAGIATKYR